MTKNLDWLQKHLHKYYFAQLVQCSIVKLYIQQVSLLLTIDFVISSVTQQPKETDIELLNRLIQVLHQ